MKTTKNVIIVFRGRRRRRRRHGKWGWDPPHSWSSVPSPVALGLFSSRTLSATIRHKNLTTHQAEKQI